jgi:hypothetical protein
MKPKNKDKHEYTREEKELIARWIRDNYGIPDCDGYKGITFVTEEVMDVYKDIFPNDWDSIKRKKTIQKYPTWNSDNYSLHESTEAPTSEGGSHES